MPIITAALMIRQPTSSNAANPSSSFQYMVNSPHTT